MLINVASVVGTVGQPYTSAYVLTKFAICGLAECLRMELQEAGDIHACTVLPASIDTPLFQHAANYTGRAVKPLSPVYDAEHVVQVILACAEHPQREVMVGNAGRVINLLHALAPALYERLAARQVKRNHFQDRPAPPSAGNLFEPMPQWTAVSGGWKTHEGLPGGRLTLGLAALAVWAWWRTQAPALGRHVTDTFPPREAT